MIIERHKRAFIIACLIARVVLCLYGLPMEWGTWDEWAHEYYSMNILNGGDIARSGHLYMTKMPCTVLNMAPWYILKSLKLDDDVSKSLASLWEKYHLEPPFGKLRIQQFIGRHVTILLSLLIPLYVYRWSKKLYGLVPGLICFFITCFEPNMIAHSRLITTDIYTAGSTLIASYYFWKFSIRGGLRYLSVSALTLGLAQLSKYSNLLLYPIFIAVALVRYISKARSYPPKEAFMTFFARDLWRFLGVCIFYSVIFIICINLGFRGYKTNMPWGSYVFRSDQFKELQSKTRALASMPVPLPFPFLEGIDGNVDAEKYGANMGHLYLFGELRLNYQAKSFPGYYLWVSLYKVPIAVLILFLTTLYLYVRKWRQFDLFNDEIFLLAPIITFGYYYNYVVVADMGVRYMMQVFPCALVLCGIVVKKWTSFVRPLKAAIVALCVYELISVISYVPHYIPYCNEFVMPRIDAYKLFAESNLDWSQGSLYAEKYVSSHPGSVFQPSKPRGGTVVMGINRYVGTQHPEHYGWLVRNCKPVGHIAYSWLIFSVDRDTLERSQEYYADD